MLDGDLTLHQFKSAKDEGFFPSFSFLLPPSPFPSLTSLDFYFCFYFFSGGEPLLSLSLKDGVTVERRVVDDVDKKKEFLFTLYQTVTPEETSEAVIAGIFFLFSLFIVLFNPLLLLLLWL